MTTTKLAYAFAVIVPGGFALLALAVALRIYWTTDPLIMMRAKRGNAS